MHQVLATLTTRLPGRRFCRCLLIWLCCPLAPRLHECRVLSTWYTYLRLQQEKLRCSETKQLHPLVHGAALPTCTNQKLSTHGTALTTCTNQDCTELTCTGLPRGRGIGTFAESLAAPSVWSAARTPAAAGCAASAVPCASGPAAAALAAFAAARGVVGLPLRVLGCGAAWAGLTASGSSTLSALGWFAVFAAAAAAAGTVAAAWPPSACAACDAVAAAASWSIAALPARRRLVLTELMAADASGAAAEAPPGAAAVVAAAAASVTGGGPWRSAGCPAAVAGAAPAVGCRGLLPDALAVRVPGAGCAWHWLSVAVLDRPTAEPVGGACCFCSSAFLLAQASRVLVVVGFWPSCCRVVA